MSNKSVLDRNFWSVTWPIMVDLSLGMGLVFTDFVFLSQSSDNAAVAVGAIFPILLLTETLYFPLGLGCSALIGKNLGAKKFKRIGQLHAISITLGLCLGLIVFSAFFMTQSHIGKWFGLSDEIALLTQQYVQIMCFSYLAISVHKVLTAIIRTHAQTKWLMYGTLIINSVNITCNLLLLNNVIDLGLTGVQNVALATLIASLAGLSWSLFCVLKKLSYRTVMPKTRLHFKIQAAQILKIAIPSVFEPANYQVSQAVLMMLIVTMGTIAVAARTYVFTILTIVVVVELAIAIASQIYTSHYIGAKRYVEADKRLRKNAFNAILLVTGINLLLYLGSGYVLLIFTDNPEIIELAQLLLLIGVFWEPAKAANFVFGQSLRASGDAMFSSYISLSLWIVALPAAYLLGINLGYGLVGVWIAITVDENVRALLHFMRWRNRWGSRSQLVAQSL